MKTKVVVVANQKGGVGKTTTAVSVAAGLALQGKDTWLVDVDPQGQVSEALGMPESNAVFDLLVNGRPAAELVQDTGRPHLWVIPGSKRTATAQQVLLTEGSILEAIAGALQIKGDGGPDYIIVDTAPSLGGLQESALYAGDLVILPCKADYLSSDGIVKIMQTIGKLANSHGWRGSILGILPTFYESTTRESRVTVEDLRQSFGFVGVLDAIHRTVALSECAGEGKTIFEWYQVRRTAEAKRAAAEYAKLVWSVRNAKA